MTAPNLDASRPPGGPAARRLLAGAGRRPRVGLLGGSFNPAHAGHLAIARRALRELPLDLVLWLVSPQNPLKPRRGMAPLAERLRSARAAAAGERRVRACAVEAELGTRFTYDTARALRRRWPKARFVWLAGADVLVQMPEWRRWQALFRALPIAVFARPDYSARAVRGAAAARFARFRRGPRGLADAAPPAWAFLRGRPHPESATRLRAGGAGGGRTGEPAISDDSPSRWAESIRRIALGSLADDKAGDVTVIDLAGKTSIADFMIVASGRSERHVKAVAEHLAARLKQQGMPPRSIEGLPKADWVLIDAGDVIVHVFRPEVRAFYNLEKMWSAPLPEPAVQ